jgi:gliding motility-associated-like protein
MRKLLLLSALISFFSYQSDAAYTQVTATSGLQVLGGISVTVSTPAGRTNPSPTTLPCGPGPYFIGAGTGNPAGGYKYDFSPLDKVTHIRLTVSDFQRDDTMYIRINNAPFAITSSMITANATCSPTAPIAAGGKLVTTALASVVTSGVITIPYGPAFVQSVEVYHDNLWSGGSGGAVYKFEFNVDSCNQIFTATADSPRCSKRDLKLFATGFPNTTFAWTRVSTPGPGAAYNSTQQNPIVPAVVYTGFTDYYICTATRGACVYKDTAGPFIVNRTPDSPIMSYKGPKCIGDKDSVLIAASIGSGGTYVIIKPNGTTEIPSIAPFNFIEVPNIQIADAGTYRGVAITSEGCITDTASVAVNLNPQVQVDFDWNKQLGCLSDSVQFIDQTLGVNIWKWSFGDTKTDTDPNPLHIYAAQGTYAVKLVGSNGKCLDSVTKQLILNHPLTADFDISADSICQNGTIIFTNNSVAAPATIPFYWWDFKDGGVDSIFNPTHKYVRYGVYNVAMTITDYLGCKKTAYKTVVVDSLGSASFFSDTIVCAGQSIQFLGDYSEIGGTYARWDFADGHTINDKFTIEHAFINPGVYDVQLTAHYRICPDTNYHQNIVVRPYPSVDLGKDTSICPNGAAFMIRDLVSPSGDPTLHYSWNTPTKDTTSYVEIHHPGVYSLTVDKEGCKVTDTLVVKKNCYIDIPNVFTPNGDGYNDYFLPRQLLSRNVTRFNMTIFNRWGDIVFQTDKVDGRGWDGKVNDKPQPEGVYVYLIKASFDNATNENYQGNITLLR